MLTGWVTAGCGDRGVCGDQVTMIFGRTGLGPGELSYPRAAVISRDQLLYVVDKAGRVQCFTLDGRYLREWRMPEWQAGKPTGLGTGPDGRIYVADTHYARVMIFEPDGRLVGQFGRRGYGPGEFIMPTDVAVDAVGNLYVSEYGGNDRISKFDRDWHYVLSFGQPGSGEAELKRPQGLLLTQDGTLWVTDACNHRVCRFTTDGHYLGSFGRPGAGVGELRFPYGLDQLVDGTLIVCEYGNNRIQRFDTDGRSLGVWGRAGRRAGELAYPWAVVTAPDDRIFVIDSGNNRVQVLAGGDARLWTVP